MMRVKREDMARALSLPCWYLESRLFRDGLFPQIERLDDARDFDAILDLVGGDEDNALALRYHMAATQGLYKWNMAQERVVVPFKLRDLDDAYVDLYIAMSRTTAGGTVVLV